MTTTTTVYTDCPRCHYDRNPADAKVCEVCETPLPQPQPVEVSQTKK